MTWDDQAVAQLRALRQVERSYLAIARKMGCSKGAVVGAMRRHIHQIPDTRSNAERNRKRDDHSPVRKAVQPKSWTDDNLTETWVARKLRRERERLTRTPAAPRP